MKSTARKLNVKFKKIREEGNPRLDVMSRQIDYVMLRPKSAALQYLRPAGIVGVQVGHEWVKFKLLDTD